MFCVWFLLLGAAGTPGEQVDGLKRLTEDSATIDENFLKLSKACYDSTATPKLSLYFPYKCTTFGIFGLLDPGTLCTGDLTSAWFNSVCDPKIYDTGVNKLICAIRLYVAQKTTYLIGVQKSGQTVISADPSGLRFRFVV